MVKVSIIVPVYNVEKYLRRCLDSLNNQTLEEIEIIMVNDGSTDSSAEICKEYLKDNKKFKYVEQSNQGLSGARNSGIKIATGEYLGFVDSDDFVTDDMFEVLYNNAIKFNVDISACGHMSYFENGNIKINTKKYIKKRYTRAEALDLFLIQELFDVVAWNKIYKREIFNETEYPIGKIYEDIQTTYKLIDKSNGVYLDSTPKYYYFQRINSISHSSFDKRMFWIIEGINDYKKICANSVRFKNEIVGEIRWYLVIYNKMIQSNIIDKEIEKNIKEMIKNNLGKIIFNRYNGLVRKIQMLLFFISVKLYKKIYLRK